MRNLLRPISVFVVVIVLLGGVGFAPGALGTEDQTENSDQELDGTISDEMLDNDSEYGEELDDSSLTADPLWGDISEENQASAQSLSDASISTFSGSSLYTNATNSGFVDYENNRVYMGSRSSTPALLYISDLDGQNSKTVSVPKSAGTWDIVKSGGLIGVGTTQETSASSAYVVVYDLQGNLVRQIEFPGESHIFSLTDDLYQTEGDNGWVWVGTYNKSSTIGASLYWVNLATGEWEKAANLSEYGVSYIRSLSASKDGVSIGAGTPSQNFVYRDGKINSVPTFSTDASFTYSQVAYLGQNVEIPGKYYITGYENPAGLQIFSYSNGTYSEKAKISLPSDLSTVDRIAVNQSTGTIWFTARPAGALYKIELSSILAGDLNVLEVSIPKQNSETRSLTVTEENTVYGVSNTGEVWSWNDSTQTTSLVQVVTDTQDMIVGDIVQNGDYTLLGGHWRYQAVNQKTGTSTVVSVPGEPKVSTVVGNDIYTAVYPVGKIQKINANLDSSTVVNFTEGQVRPSNISYSSSRNALVVSYGKAYGKHGGTVSLVNLNGYSVKTFEPKQNHQIRSLTSMDSDFILGTSTVGEGVSAPDGSYASLMRWNESGSNAGTVKWDKSLSKDYGIYSASVTSVSTFTNNGQTVVVAGTANGFLIGVDAETGSLLWKAQVSTTGEYVGPEAVYQNRIVVGLSSVVYELTASRTGFSLIPLQQSVGKYNLYDDAGSMTLVYSALANSTGETKSLAQTRAAYRVSGSDRYETAVNVSKESFRSVNTVVIVAGSSWADALVAGPLAKAADSPILLTATKNLTECTKNEITRLGAKNVVIVGGENSVSKKVLETLRNMGLQASRYAGQTRYETSVAVAKRVESMRGKMLPTIAVTGEVFADAVVATPVAGTKNATVVLVGSSNSTSRAYISARNVDTIGGKTEKLVKSWGVRVDKASSGSDRFATAEIAARTYFPTATASMVVSGLTYPDALTGGILAERSGMPLLLTLADQIPASTSTAIKRAKITWIVGGEKSVSQSQQTLIASLK